jgi:hypothetical protein
MKVFLSLGFSGRPEAEVKKEIDDAINFIKMYYPDTEFEFIHNYDYEGNNRVECLGEAIKKMSACDRVYFINKWRKHNGCLIEKNICEIYNIPHATISLSSGIIF